MWGMTLIPSCGYPKGAINGSCSQEKSLYGISANQIRIHPYLPGSEQEYTHMHIQEVGMSDTKTVKGEKHG